MSRVRRFAAGLAWCGGVVRIRDLQPDDQEYMTSHLHIKVAEVLAKHPDIRDKSIWEILGVTQVDNVFVIENQQGDCDALIMIKKTPEQGDDAAFVWLVPGPSIYETPTAFLRATKDLGSKMLDAGPYNTIWSWVSVDQPPHLRWAINWLGFEITESNVEVEGRSGRFHKVELARGVLQQNQASN
jgi:hypothetical protein